MTQSGQNDQSGPEQKLGGSAADALQTVSRPVVMLSKTYPGGFRTALHAHIRVQFLFASAGTMRARTRLGSWIVPPGYGLLIPDAVDHTIEMFGPVTLQSAYILPQRLHPGLTEYCKVIQVSPLLSASIDRFAARPVEYEETDIARPLAEIILSEIVHTPASPLALPFPRSRGLIDLCRLFLEKPAIAKNIDHLSDELGMSRRSFTRAFKRETGLSFDHWRQRLRYQAAAELLAKGGTWQQVAPVVGYSSASALKAMMERLG